MAAVQKGRIRLISPPGYQVVDRGYAADDFVSGDPVVISSSAPPSTEYDFAVERATAAEAHGLVLKDCATGGLVEFVRLGEVSGYVGLTPGAPLSIAAGDLDDTAPTGTVQIRARNAHSIYVNLV